jgi:sugar phosphate isomerase/epimerase
MKTLQYGMPTLIELPSLEATVLLCHELQLDFVELNMNLPQYQADQLDIDELQQLADRYGIYYTIHLDEAFNPHDFNKRVAMAYTETALQVIDLAEKLNVPILNMHYPEGISFKLPDRKVYLFQQYKDVYLDSVGTFRSICEAAIGSHDMKICIENTSGWDKASFLHEGIHCLLESSAFALTLDIGHNAGADGCDEGFILAQKNKFIHMHLHDAFVGTNRCHLPLGTGELEISRYLKMAQEHHCRVVLETKNIVGLKQSVMWLRERNATDSWNCKNCRDYGGELTL